MSFVFDDEIEQNPLHIQNLFIVRNDRDASECKTYKLEYT